MILGNNLKLFSRASIGLFLISGVIFSKVYAQESTQTETIGIKSSAGSVPNGNNEIQINLKTVKLILVRIPAGTFQMGSVEGEPTERPVHRVTITHDFWMGKFTVTQAQYEAVVGKNPSNWKRSDNPVERVRWEDTQDFISKINVLQDGFRFRLPTEAEWEYACRAGTTAETYGPLNEIAWYGSPLFGKTHPVGQKQPNAFGLYDMLGNVLEWCQDWFGPYSVEAQVDPEGPPSGKGQVARGGAYLADAKACRAATRIGPIPPRYSHPSLGFRVVAVGQKP